MKYALWNGEKVCAEDFIVAHDLKLDAKIREAGSNNEIKCYDEGCQEPFLLFCHGDKRTAYFRHKKSTNCQYQKFSNSYSISVAKAKEAIRNHLKEKGYAFEVDKKISGRYIHFLLKFNEKTVALELGVSSSSQKQLNELFDFYKSENIDVRWIVVGNPDWFGGEVNSCFIKRFCINTLPQQDLLIIDPNGFQVCQYKEDIQYRGDDNGFIYHQKGKIDDLVFEQGVFSLSGFEKQFADFCAQREVNYKEKHHIQSQITSCADENKDKILIADDHVILAPLPQNQKVRQERLTTQTDEYRSIDPYVGMPLTFKNNYRDGRVGLKGVIVEIVDEYKYHTSGSGELSVKIKMENGKIIQPQPWKGLVKYWLIFSDMT